MKMLQQSAGRADTSARASELCNIEYPDLNLANKTLVLRGKGPGKEPKERIVSIGSVTTKAINKTLYARLGTIQPTSPLFVVKNKYDLELPLKRIPQIFSAIVVHPYVVGFVSIYLRSQKSS